jgi:hypothetical protein
MNTHSNTCNAIVRQLSSLAIALLAATSIGCGQSSDLDKVIVRGAVTLDGQPIPNGELRFIPTNGTKGPISGGPIKDGAYVAQGRGGVPVGEHRVEIKAYRSAMKPGQPVSPEGGPAEQYLDKRFNEQTTLTVKIDSSTETQDFQLTSK